MNQETKQKRRWAIVEFVAPAEHEDMASWLMMQCGSTGCEVLPAEGDFVTVQATFDAHELSSEQLNIVRVGLEEYGLSPSLNSLRHRSFEEEDWLAKWKEGFEPFLIGENFVICPPWELEKMDPAMASGRKVLILEPGMAFGTGLHATTQYCLTALEKHASPKTVVDVGTGSGILAIACAMLHPNAQIIGVDTDPVAIEVAEKNLELNNLVGKIELVCGSTEIVEGKKFEIILSNITCEDIVSILPEYERILEDGGVVICAGILQEKLPLLERHLNERGWFKSDEELKGMWAGVSIKRKI